jgi:hypothetical protein
MLLSSLTTAGGTVVSDVCAACNKQHRSHCFHLSLPLLLLLLLLLL